MSGMHKKIQVESSALSSSEVLRVLLQRSEEKKGRTGCPWCLVVKNSPAKAGVTGSIPGQGRFYMPQDDKAQAPQLLSSHALEPVLCNEE